ncbi:F-box/WD repeat-containing protein 7 [Anopheles nili]|uniref:F-box/WD repeat-containing protein 7 n=1 Tax=Anopheles nili TaxID=185578 RepID=UPI00237A7BBB|nr:F-box/WD repeat-containing protein 7 [Anopheles nili]
MAEQCIVSIEDSKQHQAQSDCSHDLDSHPASPLSRIESPTCADATVTATSNSDDEDRLLLPDAGVVGTSPPRTTCDHHSTPTSGVTPLSSGCDGNDGPKKPIWLFSSVEQDRRHLTRMDSNGSDDVDGSLQHERLLHLQQQHQCPILLETPTLDRADDCDGTARERCNDVNARNGDMDVGKCGKQVIISDKLASAKPKRLSDEFFADDDDDDDDEEEDDVDEDEDGNGSTAKSAHRPMADQDALVDSEAQASLSEIKNLSITCNGKRKGAIEEADDEENGQSMLDRETEQDGECRDSSGSKDTAPLSTCRDASAGLAEQLKGESVRMFDDAIEEFPGHQYEQHDDVADDEELLLDDVQSMDAIERRDFEQEGGFLIRNRSLISGDRLNLEFLNTLNRPSANERSQQGQQTVPTEEAPTVPKPSEAPTSVTSATSAVEAVPSTSSSVSLCSTAPMVASTRMVITEVQHTTTPTSSRYQYKQDPHYHPHHPRDGKAGGKVPVSSTGSNSFSSSYSRETENNSTTKSAVNKLTRNLSASLANCNTKRIEGTEDEATGTTAGGTSNTTTPLSASLASSSSSSVSSSCSSSSYSLYSASAAAPEEEHALAAADAPSIENCKPELAEAFLNANSNDSVSSDRSLFAEGATEEETSEPAIDEQTKEDNTHHDPCCSTSSSASYSSSSSPSPSQTMTMAPQPSEGVSMMICSSSALPPTASHSAASSIASSSEESTTAQDKPLSSSVCSSTPDEDLPVAEEDDDDEEDSGMKVEPDERPSAAVPSSCAGGNGDGANGTLTFSCAFPKEDGKKTLQPSTSAGERSQQEEPAGASKSPSSTSAGYQSQHSQHHHRRQLHHHHHHRASAPGEGTIGTSSAASSSSRVTSASASASGTAGMASSPPAAVARDVNPAPEVVVASYHQQRDASTNTSNSPESSEPEIDEEDWADCEEGTDEEVCTCRDYTDEDGFASSEDELPSRDVDLSSYTHLDTISDDLLHDAQTPRLHRKRKLTENRALLYGDSSSPAAESLNYSSRKRLALEGTTAAGTICSTASSTGSSAAGLVAGTAAASSATGIASLVGGGVIASAIGTTPRSSLRSPLNIATTPTSSTLGERKTPRTIIPTKDNPPPALHDWLLQFQRWSNVERLRAVDRLIELCEPTQVRHMMKVIEPQFQRDFISLLPKELALLVLFHLEPRDLLRAAQTCRSWRFLADDNLLWKEKCKEGGIGIEPSTDRPKRGRTGNMPPISSPWKAAYMRQHIIEMNWRSRPIRTAKVLKGHDDHVITCLQFCGNRIVSGSDDNTLKVWSAITGKCLRTLTGHTGGVWSSQMAGNIIISGSTDRTLRVWKADTGQCMHILHGHTSTVRCMHLHGNKVVSGSRDATLRVWDVNLGTCLHMLVGHLAAVRCVQYDGKLIVSGAYDYMVKVWNPERQECLHTLQGHTNRVYSLQFDGIHVVSGSLDTSIRVWDAETGSCKHALMGHQSLTSGMELRQNILVSGNADSTVKVWDIITGQCLQTLSGPNKHQSAVTCLQFNSRFVITSSDDGTVKLWDVKTGEFIRNLVALESGGSGGVVWRIRANDTKLICAVGSRNGTEETKLMVLDFDVEGACLKCS